MIDNIEIVTVNYNTPDLVKRLIKSVREIEGNYPISIIDGSDKGPFQSEVYNLRSCYENVEVFPMGYNIHHGRGMDYALSSSRYQWCLIIDSDNYIKQPVIEKMKSLAVGDRKIVGWELIVDSQGKNDPSGFPYYHPMLLLFNTEYYSKLRNMGIGFIHHGAPAIQIMQYLHDNNLSQKVGIDMFKGLGINKSDIGEYINLASRGTVNRFGYNLNEI